MADIEQVAERVIVISHGTAIYDDRVAVMRRTLRATKLIEVGLAAPAPAVSFDGVTVAEHSATALRLVVDTARRSVRDVLDAVLDACSVDDISVSDPPLEQVIGEIYGAARP